MKLAKLFTKPRSLLSRLRRRPAAAADPGAPAPAPAPGRWRRFKRWLRLRRPEAIDEQDLYMFYLKRALLLVLVFIGASFIVAMAFIALFREGEATVPVPDLTDKPVIEAMLALQKKNLRGEVKTVFSASRAPGLVVDQEPKGGFTTREKRVVVLFVSQPTQPGEIPSLLGKTLEEARRALEAVKTTNFTVTLGAVSYAFSDDAPFGRVLAQNPLPGTRQDPPLVVDVVISKGQEATQVTLPSFAGQSIEDAVKWLAFNDLTARVDNDPAGAAGRVSGQQPADGTRVERGALVVLAAGGKNKYGVFDFVFPTQLKLSQANLGQVATRTNAAGDAAERLRLEQEQLMRRGTDRYRVRLVLVEGGQLRELLAEEKKPGDRLVVTFAFAGTAVLELQVDGQRFVQKEYQ